MSGINQDDAADRSLAAVRARHFMLTEPEAARALSASGRHQAKPGLLPLLTLPWNFPRDAMGLSLYFIAQGSVILLMLILTIISAFPLAMNLSAENFSRTYLLLDRTPIISSANVGDLWDDKIQKVCPQTSKGYPSIWNNMTVGHFCSDSTFSSPFTCPSRCVYNISKLLEPRCQNFQGSRWMDQSVDVCNVRMPCNEWEFDSEQQWKADSAYCFCCDLQLDKDKTKAIPPSIIWVWSVGAVVVYMVWLLGLSAAIASAAKRIQGNVATGASFAVLLQGPGVTTATDADIEHFARHYGPVAQVVRPTTVGIALGLAAQIRATKASIEELDAIAEGREPPHASTWLGRLPLADWLYKRMRCLHRTPAAAATAARERLVKLREDLAEAEITPLAHAAHSCVVVYNYERHAGAAVRDLRRERGLFAAKYDGPRLQKLPPLAAAEAARARPEDARAILEAAKAVNKSLKSAAGGGEEVRAERAPEASDFVWSNMIAVPLASVKKVVRVWSACIVALVLSGLVLFAFATVSEQARRERLYCTSETKDEAGKLPEGCDEDGAMTLDTGWDVSRRTITAVLQGLAVAAINSIVTLLLQVTGGFERHYLHSAGLASTTAKLSVFYLMNSVAIPIIARYITQGSDWIWYIPDGIAQEAFYIQLWNIILPNVAAITYPPNPLFSLVLSHHARTQDSADALMDPPPFLLPIRVANTVRTVALTVLYMPVLPISTVLGLINAVVSYIVDQILVLRVCRKPPTFSIKAFSFSIHIFQLLPFGWLMLMALIYFNPTKFGPEQIFDPIFPVVVGCIIWGIALLLPLQHWLGITKPLDKLASGDASYLSLVRHARDDSSRITNDDSSADRRPRVAWRPEVYCPPIPTECSEVFAKKVIDRYHLHMPPTPEITDPLPGQRPENCGEHARPPPVATGDQERVPSGVRAMFVRAAPPVQPSLGSGVTSMAAVDLTAAMTGAYY